MHMLVNGQVAWSLATWAFDDQPLVPVALSLKAGDVVTGVCRFNNASPNSIPRGTSGNSEMCSTLLWRADANAAKFCACVNGIQLCL